jgi:acetolactate synthase-1/3 small subunit
MTGLPGPTPDERPQPGGRRTAQGIRVDPEAAAEPEPRRATISALVLHQPGVLADIAGLFRQRQFNIESLSVGPTADPDYARITLVVEEPDPGIDQVEKQLGKLVPVVAVRELADDAVRRELAVVKVNGDDPEAVHAITEMYDGRTLDAGPRTITVELTGDERTIDDAIDAFRQFGIREVARTGQTALARGEESTAPADQPDDRRTPTTQTND